MTLKIPLKKTKKKKKIDKNKRRDHEKCHMKVIKIYKNHHKPKQ